MDLRYHRAVYIACCAEQTSSPFMTPNPYFFDIHLGRARKLSVRVSVMSRFGKPLVLILAFAASIHLTAAQGNDTNGLALCAVSCLNNASAYSGCSEADTDSAIACGCFDPKFQQVIGPCIIKNCDEAASERTSLCRCNSDHSSPSSLYLRRSATTSNH
ncbi:hypothetical protein BDR22DRAFT_53496 [Usnea florida]